MRRMLMNVVAVIYALMAGAVVVAPSAQPGVLGLERVVHAARQAHVVLQRTVVG